MAVLQLQRPRLLHAALDAASAALAGPSLAAVRGGSVPSGVLLHEAVCLASALGQLAASGLLAHIEPAVAAAVRPLWRQLCAVADAADAAAGGLQPPHAAALHMAAQQLAAGGLAGGLAGSFAPGHL